MIIDADALDAGLPPPLVLTVSDASQLIYVLRKDRTDASVVQFMAVRNGDGTSTLSRDLALAASGANGLRTLLLASEPQGRRGTDWARSVYGLPAPLRQVGGGPDMLDAWRVGDTPLVVASTAPGLVLQAPAWTGLLRDIRAVFDLVLIDSPALERAFTGVMLAPHVDSTVIVVAAETTRASAARILRDRLTEVGGTIAGVVLNKRRFHVPRAAYERL